VIDLADEFLSVERFEDFKQQMNRGFSDIKETLGMRINELTTEIKTMSLQSQIIYGHDKIINGLEKDTAKLEEKVLEQAIEINTLKTTQSTNQKNIKLLISLAAIFLTVLQIILRFIPVKGG
jgi:predicted RNase H-like nuclease (RuvC/YqgF family)